MALRQKIKYLRRNLSGVANLRIKTDRPERILHQAVFARGDRRLGPVIIDLAVHGLSFSRAMRKILYPRGLMRSVPGGGTKFFPGTCWITV